MKVSICVVALAVVVVHCYEDDAARIAPPIFGYWNEVGGGVVAAKEGDYPFLVNILELDRKTIVAAGVLLKSRVVLTTAYDFVKAYRPYKAEELVVQIGMHKRLEKEPSTQFLYIERIVAHPTADENYKYGDFALLKLSFEPELNKQVRTFGSKNLVGSKEEERRFVEGRGNCVVPGYGAGWASELERLYPDVMVQFNPHMRSRKYCDTLSPGTMNSRLLCSHNNKSTDNANLCLGDRGVPLLCTDGSQTKLVGLGNDILSEKCEGGGSLFAGVAMYNDWITETTKLLQGDNED